jgi:hypothetical protein
LTPITGDDAFLNYNTQIKSEHKLISTY